MTRDIASTTCEFACRTQSLQQHSRTTDSSCHRDSPISVQHDVSQKRYVAATTNMRLTRTPVASRVLNTQQSCASRAHEEQALARQGTSRLIVRALGARSASRLHTNPFRKPQSVLANLIYARSRGGQTTAAVTVTAGTLLLLHDAAVPIANSTVGERPETVAAPSALSCRTCCGSRNWRTHESARCRRLNTTCRPTRAAPVQNHRVSGLTVRIHTVRRASARRSRRWAGVPRRAPREQRPPTD